MYGYTKPYKHVWMALESRNIPICMTITILYGTKYSNIQSQAWNLSAGLIRKEDVKDMNTRTRIKTTKKKYLKKKVTIDLLTDNYYINVVHKWDLSVCLEHDDSK